MVKVNGKKYACRNCINGHRSSSCSHTTRPLFEIKKKGRPVSQCETCRARRKVQKIHVRCVCDEKPSVEPPMSKAPGRKTAPRRIPEIPDLPNGLKDLQCGEAEYTGNTNEKQKVAALLNASSPQCADEFDRSRRSYSEYHSDSSTHSSVSSDSSPPSPRSPRSFRELDTDAFSKAFHSSFSFNQKQLGPGFPPNTPPIDDPKPRTHRHRQIVDEPVDRDSSLGYVGSEMAARRTSHGSTQAIINQSAALIPPPPGTSARLPQSNSPFVLAPFNTAVCPPAAFSNGDVARGAGLVHISPLNCCAGGCRCPTNECTCTADCNNCDSFGRSLPSINSLPTFTGYVGNKTTRGYSVQSYHSV